MHDYSNRLAVVTERERGGGGNIFGAMPGVMAFVALRYISVSAADIKNKRERERGREIISSGVDDSAKCKRV